jgi:hypothetical protein
MALFVSLHGILICTLSGALQGIVYLIPLTFTIIRVILKSYFKLSKIQLCLYFPIFVGAIIFSPVASALVVLVFLFYCIFRGIESGIEAYKESFYTGIKMAYKYVQANNEFYLKILCN